MSFVIFSYHYLPMNDAEAYCTARFAGALAFMGHSVTVVTMDHPAGVSEEVLSRLTESSVRIIRIPVIRKKKPVLSRLRYVTYEWESVNFSSCIKMVREAVSELEDPVLITRSNPLASAVIGWHCRKNVKKWIAHFSDPVPIPGRNTAWNDLHRFVHRFWISRILRDADIVSVTCPNAVRAYREEYRSAAERTRFIVTPHIGDPPLRKAVSSGSNSGCCRIVHNGLMCQGRGAGELIRAVALLNKNGKKCEFVQCGQVDDVGDLFENNPLAFRRGDCEGEIDYIPDLKVPLDYCPFLSSKFVYRIYDNKPILLYTARDSFAAEMAMKYPEAGIFFADNTREDSLVEALSRIMTFPAGTINRAGIRQEFTRERIIDEFISGIQ